jgi:hypothetical protein
VTFYLIKFIEKLNQSQKFQNVLLDKVLRGLKILKFLFDNVLHSLGPNLDNRKVK